MFQSTVGPIRRLTPQPTDRGRADCLSLKGEATKKASIVMRGVITHLRAA